MIQFIPYPDRTYNNIIYQPRLSNITHIGMQETNFDNDHVRYELKNFKGTSNIVQNTPKVETVNTQTQDYKYMQTTTINLSQKIYLYTNL